MNKEEFNSRGDLIVQIEKYCDDISNNIHLEDMPLLCLQRIAVAIPYVMLACYNDEKAKLFAKFVDAVDGIVNESEPEVIPITQEAADGNPVGFVISRLREVIAELSGGRYTATQAAQIGNGLGATVLAVKTERYGVLRSAVDEMALVAETLLSLERLEKPDISGLN